MDKQKIQSMISKEILNQMLDKSAAMVLRNILFDPNNNIDWDKAYTNIMKNMPELRSKDEYRKENIQ